MHHQSAKPYCTAFTQQSMQLYTRACNSLTGAGDMQNLLLQTVIWLTCFAISTEQTEDSGPSI